MRNPRRALVTGVNGQDGSYLAHLLLVKGYEVVGVTRNPHHRVISHLYESATQHGSQGAQFDVIHGDLRSTEWVVDALNDFAPTEIYNLAAQSNVALSFTEPELTHEVNYVAVSKFLDALEKSTIETKFFQASSSEMFGLTKPPQSEASPFLPQSPYALSKTGSHVLVGELRQRTGRFAVSGISFNHESPRRPTTFVTRKITAAVASIVRGESYELHRGNIEAIRGWGYAPEYVEGMWRSLQHDEAHEYVLASGTGNTVRDFADYAFGSVGLDWRDYVSHDENLKRVHDMTASIGDATLAKSLLGWEASITAQDLARIMVESDLNGAGELDVPRLERWQ